LRDRAAERVDLCALEAYRSIAARHFQLQTVALRTRTRGYTLVTELVSRSCWGRPRDAQ
jgi:hypothetical protein